MIDSTAALSETKPLGSLYSIDSRKQLEEKVDQLRIANGLAFNDKLKKFYYIDSLKLTVDRFDFDIQTGTLCKFQKSGKTGGFLGVGG